MIKSLTDLFEDITQGLAQDRDTLNGLDDVGDGDAGDNMVNNFSTITNALRQVEDQDVTVDQALNHASQVLRQQGHGPTAPMYANGLVQAANNLQGKKSFGLDDITGLLGGLLGGVQQTPGIQPQGKGGLLDGLLPGVMGFMQLRNAGKSTIEALLGGFMASQRGAMGTARQSSGFGNFADRQTQGRVDPGAAGASSMLGSLFNSLLSGGLSASRREPARSEGISSLFDVGGLGSLFGSGGQGGQQQPAQSSGGLSDLLGGLLGGQGGGQGGQQQPQGGGLSDLLGGLLGGGGQSAPQSGGGSGSFGGGARPDNDEPRARIGPKEIV